jgi:hypothetical protein
VQRSRGVYTGFARHVNQVSNKLKSVKRTFEERPLYLQYRCRKPLCRVQPELETKGVFFERFFNGFSYADLASKYEMSEDNARKTFHNTVKRVLEILKVMASDKPLDLSSWKTRIEERSGKIPKGQKWFLLNKLFVIMPSEIAEMEGLKGSSSVRQLIIRVSDQLKAGEIRLIDTTPEESAAAKMRLDAKREKRRKK